MRPEQPLSDEALVESILDGIVDGVIVVDRQGTILRANPATQRLFGYPLTELGDRKLGLLVPELGRTGPAREEGWDLRARLVEIAGEGRDLLGKHRDGTLFPLELSINDVRTADGHFLVAVVRDITERKHAEEAAARLGRVLENSWNEIYAFDSESLRFVQVSRGALLNLGYSEQEMMRLTPVDIKPEYTRERFLELAAPLVAGSERLLTFETIHRRRDGSTYPVEIRMQLSRAETPPVFVAIIQDITERRRAEEQLRKSEERLSLHVQQTPLAVIEWGPDLRIVEWNPAAKSIFGYRREEALGRHASELFARESGKGPRYKPWEGLLSGDSHARRSTSRNVTRDGRSITCEWYHTPLIDDNGRTIGITSLGQDITERVRARDLLFEEKERAQVTLESIGDAVITTDARGAINYMNPVAEDLTGWTQHEAAGRPLAEVFDIVNEITRAPVEDPVSKCLRKGRIVGLANHTVLIGRHGREVAIEDSAAPIRARNGEIIGVVLIFHDVTKARALAQQLSWQASHDPLTGLGNRREFEHRLERAIADAQENNEIHALLYLDLDQFKVVNDTCGHTAGDELLKQLGLLLRDKVRENDTLARLGGDEFGLLLENCTTDRAVSVARHLADVIKDYRFVWQDKSFAIGASIGVVGIRAGRDRLADVLSKADMACYAAKDAGRNRAHVYEEGDAEIARQHGEMQWVSRITRALEEDRFILHAQAIRPADPGQPHLERYEVLLRMVDDAGAVISPMSFIPAAERFGLMPAIDRWVIKKLLAWLQESGSRSEHLGQCAINLSGHSLGDDHFLDFVVNALRESGVPADKICFEITETAAIANLSRALRLIKVLKGMGCRFALDDFGSGLSSFAYLKTLPVDYLKIDGGFVRDMVSDPIDYAMVEAINQIGHVMGIRTIAEFVENDAILDRLRAIGVDFVQGYGIHAPEPLG